MERWDKHGNDEVDKILQELRSNRDKKASSPGQGEQKERVAGVPASSASSGGKEEASSPALPGESLFDTPRKNTRDAEESTVVFDVAKETGEEEKPVAKPARTRRRKTEQTAIWDLEVTHSEYEHRTGKAAALEKVERDKYAGETELLSWFSPEEDLSPKERRRLQKEERQRKKQQEKEEKRQGQFAQEDPFEPEEMPDWDREGFDSLFAEGETLFGEAQPEMNGGENGAEEGPDEAFFEREMQAARLEGEALVPEPEEAELPADSLPDDLLPPPVRPVVEGQVGFLGMLIDKDTDEEKVMREAWAAPPEEDKDAEGDVPVAEESPRPLPTGEPQELPTEEDPSEERAGAEDATAPEEKPPTGNAEKLDRTQTYDVMEDGDGEFVRVPTAAFTQEFRTEEGDRTGTQNAIFKNLFVDEMAADDRFRAFFSETVSVSRESIEQENEEKRQNRKRKRKKNRSVATGEFAQLAQAPHWDEEEMPEGEEELADYNQPQDAEGIEKDLAGLKRTLLTRCGITAGLVLLLLWHALAALDVVGFPAFMAPDAKPLFFAVVYALLATAALMVNFTTVAAGLVGLFGEPTGDTPPALAAVAALLQGVVLVVQALVGGTLSGVTLFGAVAALLLLFNALGKYVRAHAIARNFQTASAGYDHSAAYVLDGGHEVAYEITNGLDEDDPTLLVSRPTALVKGFMRQSFSLRWTDRLGRVLGWVLLGVAVFAALVSYIQTKELLLAISSLTAVMCIGAPLSSTLISGIPSLLLQQSTARVGAVVPGWSAIEELGQVNTVIAEAQDIFPAGAVELYGIKTYEKERIDLAILYAASVLSEGCSTLRHIFMGVIQEKADMLYKVESMTFDPGQGFTAWVNNSRVVVGTREMIQKHDIAPPPLEQEMKYTAGGRLPVYLGVSGKLFAMFIVGYRPDEEVQDTLDGLVKSGVSLLVTSDDMNVTSELIEDVYQLPEGVVKVLGRRELEILEPLTEYRDESEGVMTHIGSFASFIGGMRAAAGCAASEHMAGVLQIAAVVLACLLSILLAFSGGLAGLSLVPVLIYQLAWTLMVSAVPLARRY